VTPRGACEMPEITTLGLQIAEAAAPFEDDVQYVADEPLSALRVVRAASPGRLRYARPGEVEALAPIGVTTGASSTGQRVQLATRGPLSDASWHWTAGVPVMVVIGLAIATDTIVIRMAAPIDLAPGG
jgi:hypothetical protein